VNLYVHQLMGLVDWATHSFPIFLMLARQV
jgi:hypothetical protein